MDNLCKILDFLDLIKFKPDVLLVTLEAKDLEALISLEL